MRVFFNGCINFFNPVGEGISLIVLKKFSQSICILAVHNKSIFLIDECKIVLIFLIVLLRFHWQLYNSCDSYLIDWYIEMSTVTFCRIIFISLLIVSICSKWSMKEIIQSVHQELECVELRSQESIRLYGQLKQKIKESKITIPIYIENEKFGYDGQACNPIFFLTNITYESQMFPAYLLTNNPTKHEWISTIINDQSRISGLSKDNAFLLVTINDFPYDVADGIEHWLVWSNRRIKVQMVNQLLNAIKSEGYQFYAFENPQRKKSIPEIFHAQVFIQKIEKSTDSEL